MALNFDGPPVYDPLTSGGAYISDIWVAWLATFGQTLAEYLTQNGIFTPLLTTAQRDQIQSPQLGQLIYNTSTNELQVWQIKLGVAAWRAVTTVP